VEELSALQVRASDIRRGWFTVREASDAQEAGKRAAAAVDDLVADNAYAAEAVLSYLADQRKDAPRGPLAIVGMSAGALAAPGVAARLGERVSAVVMVGGGADLFQISRTSDLKKTGIQFRQDEKTPMPEALARGARGVPCQYEAGPVRARADAGQYPGADGDREQGHDRADGERRVAL
jgi:pimeloyl-ACP methyl ester carboxylesterase